VLARLARPAGILAHGQTVLSGYPPPPPDHVPAATSRRPRQLRYVLRQLEVGEEVYFRRTAEVAFFHFINARALRLDGWKHAPPSIVLEAPALARPGLLF
jgi:hypothetical protein